MAPDLQVCKLEIFFGKYRARDEAGRVRTGVFRQDQLGAVKLGDGLYERQAQPAPSVTRLLFRRCIGRVALPYSPGGIPGPVSARPSSRSPAISVSSAPSGVCRMPFSIRGIAAKTAASSSACRKADMRSGGICGGFRLKNVARAADGLDHRVAERLLDLAAHAADMGFHDAGGRIEVQVPNLFQQHVAGRHPAPEAQKSLWQAKLLDVQLDAPVFPPAFAPVEI